MPRNMQIALKMDILMRTRLVIAAALASVTIGFAQAPPGNPGGGRGGEVQLRHRRLNVPARGSASVRVPAWRQLRTAVGNLLGWQVGVSLGSFRQDTFLEAARKAEALDLAVVAGDSTQKISVQIPKNLDYRLAPGEMDAVRDRMTTLNVRMPVYFTAEISEDEPDRAKAVRVREEPGRGDDGSSSKRPESLPAIEKLADEFGVNVALSGSPKTVLEALQGRGRRIGAYADLGKWMQEGVAPLDGIALLKDRLLALKLGDRSALGKSAPLLAEIYRRELKPSLITVDTSGGPDVVADLSRSLEAFEKAVQPVVAERVTQLSRGIPIKGPDRLTPEEREKITAATPQKPAATPKASQKAADLRREHWLWRREWRASFDPGGEHGDRAVRENRRLRGGVQQRSREFQVRQIEEVRRGVSEQHGRADLRRSRDSRRLEPFRA